MAVHRGWGREGQGNSNGGSFRGFRRRFLARLSILRSIKYSCLITTVDVLITNTKLKILSEKLFKKNRESKSILSVNRKAIILCSKMPNWELRSKNLREKLLKESLFYFLIPINQEPKLFSTFQDIPTFIEAIWSKAIILWQS